MANIALDVPIVVRRSKRMVGFSQGMCRPWAQDTSVVVHLPRGVSYQQLGCIAAELFPSIL